MRQPGRARSVRISRYIGSPSIVSPGIWAAGHHQASLIEPSCAPAAIASRRPSPRAVGAPTGASIGPRRNAFASCGSRSKPPVASTTASASGSDCTRAPGLHLDARVEAGLEHAGEQRAAERERAALLALRERLAIDLAGRELDVGDRRGHVRRVAHERRDLGRGVDRQRLERAAALLAAALELGVVVAVGDRLPGHRRLALDPLDRGAGLPREHLQDCVVGVAERDRPEVGEAELGGVVGHVAVAGEPAVAAGERGRAADPVAGLEHGDLGAGLRRRQGGAEAGGACADDRDAPHIEVSPPSGTITWPVMKLASFESRKQTGSAISRGSPIRPIGIPGIASAAPFSKSPPPRSV